MTEKTNVEVTISEEIDFTIRLHFEYSDHGIGAYDFWGQLGNDVDYAWTLEYYEIISVHSEDEILYIIDYLDYHLETIVNKEREKL